jgi:hypothetical protein
VEQEQVLRDIKRASERPERKTPATASSANDPGRFSRSRTTLKEAPQCTHGAICHAARFRVATNGMTCATQATLLAARRPRLTIFNARPFGGRDRDSEKIVGGSRGTINLPEPVGTIYTKYFSKKDP